MKVCCLLIFLFAFNCNCFSQTGSVKLYGFRQAVAGGVPSSYETDEQGKKVETTNKPSVNFFIYLSYPPDLMLSVEEVWMNGEIYKVKEEAVDIPVEITYDNGIAAPETIALIPQTTDTVTRIILLEKLSSRTKAIKKSLAETNDLVLVYRLHNRFYAQTLKRIRGLRVGVMQ
jgi:hypothetical protein